MIASDNRSIIGSDNFELQLLAQQKMLVY